MNLVEISKEIENGNVSLGIELGSTRIKAVLITSDYKTIASGSFVWENQFKDQIWTYSLDTVWQGIQASYSQMAAEVHSKYHQSLTSLYSYPFPAIPSRTSASPLQYSGRHRKLAHIFFEVRIFFY